MTSPSGLASRIFWWPLKSMPVFSSLEALSACSHFMSLLLRLLRDLHVPEEKAGKVSVHVEICQSIADRGCEKQPKSPSHRGIEMWTDGWMGRQFLIWAAEKQSWRRGWRVGRVAESGHSPGSQGPAASTHHTFAAGSILGTKEKRKDPQKHVSSGQPWGKRWRWLLGGHLSSLLIMEFTFGKNVSDCPSHFRFTGPKKGGGRIEKLVAEPERCWRWNLGHKWDSVSLW